MMYKIFFFTCFYFVIILGYGQNPDKMCIYSNSVSFIKRIDSLEYYANKLTSENCEKTHDSFESQFFQYFPCSFTQFDSIYGFDDISGLSPLYYEAQNHICNVLFNLKSLDLECFVRKSIMISIGGVWKPDAVSYFQYELRKYVLKNADSYCEILQEYPEEQIYSFWKFLFDSPYPENHKWELKKMYEKINNCNSDLAIIMLQAVD